ncbi:MAG: SDR family NAD(P)-dependent oxidoreductase [Breznakibacter sp.]
MKLTTLITGATSGIGEAMAYTLARLGYRLVLTGRRSGRLDTLCGKLGVAHDCECLPLVFDIRNNQQTMGALASLPEQWKRIDLLVNNAGLAAGIESYPPGKMGKLGTDDRYEREGIALYFTANYSPNGGTPKWTNREYRIHCGSGSV